MRSFEDHTQWSTVKEVAARLRANGHLALLAGGCVRDLLMNRIPQDFDIASDATPEQVSLIFPNALMVGRVFGVTILPFENFQVEVATFRQDLAYSDGRRPDRVKFSTPEEDAKRRDFTVNALFFDIETTQIIDFVGGRKDIEDRVLRTVGVPEERFNEDQLRLLRGVRFAAQLEFEIAPDTLAAMTTLSNRVNSVSRERIRDEIVKLMHWPARVRGLELLVSTGLLTALFPDLMRSLSLSSGGISVRQWLDLFLRVKVATLPETFLALFFYPLYSHAREREFRESYLKTMKLETGQIEQILFALRNWQVFVNHEGIRSGELVLLLADRLALGARELARVLAPDSSNWEAPLDELVLRSLGANKQKPEPFLNGADAKNLGVMPGAEMGKWLKEAYLLQLEGQFVSKPDAVKWLADQVKRLHLK